MKIEVLGQYEHGAEAVHHALNLVISYLISVDLKESTPDKIALKNAPLALLNETSTADTVPSAIACFDIDATLLFDEENATLGIEPNRNVLMLLNRLHELGVEIHLITARRNDEEMRLETLKELHSSAINIEGKYKTLSLAPERHRSNMSTISRWKMECRRLIAMRYRCPITISIGDQWGDIVVLRTEDDLDKLDEVVGTENMPYVVVRTHDGCGLWGLKLRSD